MREPLKDKNRLEHILDAIEIISQRTSVMGQGTVCPLTQTGRPNDVVQWNCGA